MEGAKKRPILENGSKIGCYTINSLLGQGGYGDIYSVSFQDSSGDYAMKVEAVDAQRPSLAFEADILKELQDSTCFPKIVEFGQNELFSYLVMERLGPSVSQTRRQFPSRKFHLPTVLRMAVFMLHCIEEFHKHEMIHCDIKPGNFLLRSGSKNPLALIDYGLSKRFIDPETGEIIPEKEKAGFRGTTKYASKVAHEGHDLGKKDDLYSWIYSVVELIEGKLPWGAEKKHKKIKILKSQLPPAVLFHLLPSQFIDIIKHIDTLTYADTPDYELINAFLMQAIISNSIQPYFPFDWETLSDKALSKFSPHYTLPVASDTSLIMVHEHHVTFRAVEEVDERHTCSKTCNLI